MINSFFLFLGELLEFCAVILSLPAKAVGYAASFCYGASRAYNDEDTNSDDS